MANGNSFEDYEPVGRTAPQASVQGIGFEQYEPVDVPERKKWWERGAEVDEWLARRTMEETERAKGLPVIGPHIEKIRKIQAYMPPFYQAPVGQAFEAGERLGTAGMGRITEAIRGEPLPEGQTPESMLELGARVLGKEWKEPPLPFIGKGTSPVNVALFGVPAARGVGGIAGAPFRAAQAATARDVAFAGRLGRVETYLAKRAARVPPSPKKPIPLAVRVPTEMGRLAEALAKVKGAKGIAKEAARQRTLPVPVPPKGGIPLPSDSRLLKLIALEKRRLPAGKLAPSKVKPSPVAVKIEPKPTKPIPAVKPKTEPPKPYTVGEAVDLSELGGRWKGKFAVSLTSEKGRISHYVYRLKAGEPKGLPVAQYRQGRWHDWRTGEVLPEASAKKLTSELHQLRPDLRAPGAKLPTKAERRIKEAPLEEIAGEAGILKEVGKAAGKKPEAPGVSKIVSFTDEGAKIKWMTAEGVSKTEVVALPKKLAMGSRAERVAKVEAYLEKRAARPKAVERKTLRQERFERELWRTKEGAKAETAAVAWLKAKYPAGKPYKTKMGKLQRPKLGAKEAEALKETPADYVLAPSGAPKWEQRGLSGFLDIRIERLEPWVRAVRKAASAWPEFRKNPVVIVKRKSLWPVSGLKRGRWFKFDRPEAFSEIPEGARVRLGQRILAGKLPKERMGIYKLATESEAGMARTGWPGRVERLMAKGKLTREQAERIVRFQKGHELEKRLWFTKQQARKMKRELTAPEGLEGIERGVASLPQINRLIASLRNRAGKEPSRAIISEITGKKVLSKGISFEKRREIAQKLLEKVPEGHRPRILSRAFGKPSMADMTPTEANLYVQYLEHLPSVSVVGKGAGRLFLPFDITFGSPYRLFEKAGLGVKAQAARIGELAFVEHYMTRLGNQAEKIVGKMTRQRREAIHRAIELTIESDQPLSAALKKAIGPGAEGFVREARVVGDELFELLRSMNPSVKYRKGHILRFWKRTGFFNRLLGPKKGEMKPWEVKLGKKMEMMPEDLMPGTTVKTAGEFPRKGAPGFRRDPFEALEREIRRIAKKIYWEPVYRDMRTAMAEADPVTKGVLNRWMRDLKGREGTTDKITKLILQGIYDATRVGRVVPRKPFTRGAMPVVHARYLAVLGANLGPVVKNMTQRLNHYAEFGGDPLAVVNGIKKAMTSERIKLARKAGVIEEFEMSPFIKQLGPRTFARKAEEALMAPFGWMEKKNRIEAFSVGYEWSVRKGMTHEVAVARGLKSVRDTQFLYGPIGMGAVLRTPAGKVAFQLLSYPIKQIEWLTRHMREGNWAVVMRYAVMQGAAIHGARALGIDLGSFLGWNQFDFRSPIFWRSAVQFHDAVIKRDPIAKKKAILDLKRSWIPPAVAARKTYRLVTKEGTPKEKAMRFLSLYPPEKTRLWSLYGRRSRLEKSLTLARRDRNRKKIRSLERQLPELEREIKRLERKTGVLRERSERSRRKGVVEKFFE